MVLDPESNDIVPVKKEVCHLCGRNMTRNSCDTHKESWELQPCYFCHLQQYHIGMKH